MDIKKLVEYGFADWQIDTLLKKKRLDTVHGRYKLLKDKLYLIQDDKIKKVI